jgi:SAM-dependent methyltransferase
MMGEVFGQYSQYYDLLYKYKDYQGEADYIEKLINRHSPSSESILDLGCGTGRHAVLMAEKGYSIHGVDLSHEMLQLAENSKEQLEPEVQKRLTFSHENICKVKLDQKFDVVTSLFHVVSYLKSTEEMKCFLKTAKNHLKPNGVLIFDCWYGPAVLSEPPVVRVKRIENEEIKVTRIAEPDIHYCENSVDVNYQIFIKSKTDGVVEELGEKHTMRYLFHPEILDLFTRVGLSYQDSHEWMTDKPPGADTWGVCIVGKSH